MGARENDRRVQRTQELLRAALLSLIEEKGFEALTAPEIGSVQESVNTIGPIVDLTPGSISIAVERLFAKGLVTRVESTEDRRVRIIARTPRGKDLIVPAFRKHSGQMSRVFSELNAEELHCLEVALERLRKRAAGGE